MTAADYAELIEQLRVRGRGNRESGAFLLAAAEPADDASRAADIISVAYYDDLDPACLTGGITFGADGYTALAVLCRTDRLRVVADIHTHPKGWVRQSDMDAAHPMTALPGHIALIAPYFAAHRPSPSDLGAHVFQGAGRWDSYLGPAAARILSVRTPTPAGGATGGHRLVAFLRRLLDRGSR